MKRFLLPLALLLVCATTQARFVCDTTCHAPDDGINKYAVVSPIGRSGVTFVEQGPRLETLDNKTIAVVGVSFMAHVTHPEIKRLIEENYTNVRVLLTDEMGYAGPYPGNGIDRPQAIEFKKKLKEYGVDAVIAGNGGCGICTPKETGSAIAAESLGIPAVVVAAPGFTSQAASTGYNNGIKVLRAAEYPGAFATHTEEQLIENTRNIVWPQLVKALTTPITEEEIAAAETGDHGDLRDDVFYGTMQEIDEQFRKMNWTDGLPIYPPTYDEAERYVSYSGYRWNNVAAVMPGATRIVLVWHVAVNAIMAGCKPEHMPLLVAMTKAMKEDNFRRTLLSTHGWVPYCILNGPLARQLGLDTGQGQINEHDQMCIGRFLNLAMINMMGYYTKDNRMGTFGYPMAWCLMEDDAACHRLGWEPYHVQQGCDINESAVTVTSALQWGNNMAISTQDPNIMMKLIAWDCSERGQCALGSSQQFTPRTILMTEPVARNLKEGFETLDELEDSLILHSRRPVKERAYANLYANTGGQKDYSMNQYTRHIAQTEGGEDTPTEPWYDRTEATTQTVPCMQKGQTAFIITGDTARNKVQVMQGGYFGTYKVELPDNWNELMMELGYAPIENFYIKEDGGGTATEISSVPTEDLPIRFNGYNIINNEHKYLAIYDTSGKMVARTKSNFNLRSLRSGVYFVYIAGIRGANKVVVP